MDIIVTAEITIPVPDDSEDLDRAVTDFINRNHKIPLGIFFKHLNVCGIRKIEPWEDSIKRW